MDEKAEATLSVLAALLVLFTALLDPVISASLAVVFLGGLATYKIVALRGK